MGVLLVERGKKQPTRKECPMKIASVVPIRYTTNPTPSRRDSGLLELAVARIEQPGTLKRILSKGFT
jgi:hypothetical protein